MQLVVKSEFGEVVVCNLADKNLDSFYDVQCIIEATQNAMSCLVGKDELDGPLPYDQAYLQWYRDRGLGQEASNCLNAEESMLGTWPIARLTIRTRRQQDHLWNKLFTEFQINAMMYCVGFNGTT